jgi:hypothetical protein
MINIKELEKFVTSGKVVTLVIMVDGKELAAMSFSLDTIAFKEILETAKTTEVKIPDKEPEKEVKKEKKAKVEKKDTPKSEPEPEPLNEVKKANDFIEKAEETKALTREQIMTEYPLAGNSPDPRTTDPEVRANEHSGSKSAEQDGQPESANKPELNLFKDEW